MRPFTVIGERINMTRKSIRTRVWERDEEFIRGEARKQMEAGANIIDINAGGDPEKEIEDMKWLTGIVADEIPLPLSFDSANPEAIRAGLEICNRPGTIVNSITLEKERVKTLAPLIDEYGADVICLTMNDEGMPEDYQGRIALADEFVTVLSGYGLRVEQLIIDFLVRPASTNPGQVRFILAAIRYIMLRYPEIHCSVGLSNVSFGIPVRNNFNRAFLAMVVEAGADAAIIDPTENEMMLFLKASQALVGDDEYCMEYLAWMREKGLA